MKLLQAALCLSLAMLLAVLAWHASETNIKAAVLCAGLALILAIVGASLIADWIVERADEHAMARAQASAITPASELAERVSMLNSDQMLFLLRQSIEIDLLTSPDQPPIYAIRTAGEPVPLDFAREYLLLTSPGGELYPVRNYSDGSHERRWANDLTSLLKSHKFIEDAAGNRPARLLPYVTLAQVGNSLGVEI